MKDNKEFASFLLDDGRNDEIFQDYYNKVKIHKEKYNDRFVVLYSKKYTDNLYQEKYDVSGYFDIKDNCLYNASYTLQNIFKENPTIKYEYFSTIHKKIFNDVKKYVENYSFENKAKLKKIALEEFNNYSPSQIDNYKKTVETDFVKGINIINFNPKICDYDILHRNEEYEFNSYVNYLINPDDLVKSKAKHYIGRNEQQLGISLLVYEAQEKYLKEIQTNKNNKYKDIYCIKEIYDSIKNIPAKTLNITIKYNNEYYTFNFSYARLKNSLELVEKGSCDYGSSYLKVANFIKNNSDNPERVSNYENFLFDNVVSITYGRNELYKKDENSNIIIKNKNKNKDYER